MGSLNNSEGGMLPTMEAIGPPDSNTAARARAWRDGQLATVCDVLRPWEHGTVARATDRPGYWNFNVVTVADDPGLGVAELEAFADEALDGLDHRRLDFDSIDAAERLRPDFEGRGWIAERLVWMRHELPVPPGPASDVAEVPFDAVRDLRVRWHFEDYPDQDPELYLDDSREISLRRGARVIASLEDGKPVAFAQLEWDAGSAEITHVYVDAEHRGGGRGTAMTRAAIAAAAGAGDLWIVADDEDRPKELYGRLGFRPAWISMEFLRLPS